MGSLMETEKRTARKKGLLAAAAGAGAVALAIVINPVIGLIGAAGAGYLAVDWFMYRAKRGMRF